MNTSKKSDDFYKKLKKQLAESTTWPSQYLYKFIVPTDQQKIDSIQNMFDNLGAVIEIIPSKKGKYTSVSITVEMENPDAVIAKYKAVGEKIEGVISL